MDCPIKKILSSKSVVTKSKHICEIENFVKSKSIFSAQIPIFEFDSEWLVYFHIIKSYIWLQLKNCFCFREVEIITQYSSEFYFKFQINLNETIELENLQFQVSVGSGSIRIVDSGFSEVKERVLTCKVCAEKKTLLNLVSKEGRLTIELQVELKYTPDPISFRKQLCSKNTKLQLADQYSSLLNDETYSDFTFIVQGKSFKVHKNILANVSETMRTMFASQLKETMKGECHVEDIEPSVFQNMLQFIYAGIIPANLDDVSFALYKQPIITELWICWKYAKKTFIFD